MSVHALMSARARLIGGGRSRWVVSLSHARPFHELDFTSDLTTRVPAQTETGRLLRIPQELSKRGKHGRAGRSADGETASRIRWRSGLVVAAPDKLLTRLLDHLLVDRTASFTCISAACGCLSGFVMVDTRFLQSCIRLQCSNRG